MECETSNAIRCRRVCRCLYQTVSRVVNQASQRFCENARKVEAAMAELNYIPNRVAQQLAGKQSLLIGVATSSLAPARAVANCRGD